MYVRDNTRKLIKFCLLSYLIPAPFLPKGQTARTTDTLRKKPSLHSQKFNPKFLGTAEAFFCFPHRMPSLGVHSPISNPLVEIGLTDLPKLPFPPPSSIPTALQMRQFNTSPEGKTISQCWQTRSDMKAISIQSFEIENILQYSAVKCVFLRVCLN